MTLGQNPFENFVGKRENAGNQDFLFILQCFLHDQGQISLSVIFNSSFTNAFNLDQTKVMSFGKGLSNVIIMVRLQFDSKKKMLLRPELSGL